MVAYCCVKGCRNNSAEKWKGYNANITFHVLPTNPKAKRKWLKAIGRPTWDPPNHARICSAHFNNDQINRDHQRTRLKEDACPVLELPSNSYFEAVEMEVCRICLVMDVKMYSLQNKQLKLCVKSIIALNKDVEGLPDYVCYECAFQLVKCYNLIQRSNIAKATLLNIFFENGEVTKQLVKNVNRDQLNLKSSLTHNKVTPKTILTFQYDDNLDKYIHETKTTENISQKEEKSTVEIENCLKKFKMNLSKNNKEIIDSNHETEKTATKCDSNNDNRNSTEENECKVELVTEPEEELENDKLVIETNELPDNFVSVNSVIKDDPDSDSEFNIDDDDAKMEESYESFEENEPLKNLRKTRKKSAKKNPDGLTPDEVEMQKYFDVVILSLEEQIEDRERMKESAAYRDALYKCEVCYKTYLHPNAFKMHMDNHDPSRGSAECPVCRLRYKNDVLARSHANRTHGKKFYCKSCPKVFNNVRIAKKHERRHAGHVYSCSHCAFTSPHESAYATHVRARHATHARARHARCELCGVECENEEELRLHEVRLHGDQPVADDASKYRCSECDIRFPSQNAWRVHMMTSRAHKKNRDESGKHTAELLKTTCVHCGIQFPSERQLRQHAAETHEARAKTRQHDVYPADCNICGAVVNNRKEHYFHVRKLHPEQRDSYQPLISAVCDTCGKGFQNTTKLHLHELRHTGVGTVRCPHCPRLCYDKYQLARHVGVHSDARPYACRLCDKAFKLRSNLDRHAKVHSGATPYECTMCGKRFRYSSSRNLHVRTVHYRLPHPPRQRAKPRSGTAADE